MLLKELRKEYLNIQYISKVDGEQDKVKENLNRLFTLINRYIEIHYKSFKSTLENYYKEEVEGLSIEALRKQRQRLDKILGKVFPISLPRMLVQGDSKSLEVLDYFETYLVGKDFVSEENRLSELTNETIWYCDLDFLLKQVKSKLTQDSNNDINKVRYDVEDLTQELDFLKRFLIQPLHKNNEIKLEKLEYILERLVSSKLDNEQVLNFYRYMIAKR